MASGQRPRKRQREDFWRAHHEAWKSIDLNQRQYCELHGLPQKALENSRQMFRREPPQRKLPYRRRPVSPPLSPPASPLLNPGAYAPRSWQLRLFNDRARVIVAGSATQTHDEFSKTPPGLRGVPRRGAPGTA